MRVIIGLGNPGKQYEKTRHNAGFILLDEIQKDFDFPKFKIEKKFDAEISEGIFNEEKIILTKPINFMNLSGESVRKILDFYKLSPEDIVVIHDDLDIKIENFRIATDSSSAGHNGVQNIIDNLGTQKFKRIRIGIGYHPPRTDKQMSPQVETSDTQFQQCRLGAHNFVLEKFSNEEFEKIIDLAKKIERDL